MENFNIIQNCQKKLKENKVEKKHGYQRIQKILRSIEQQTFGNGEVKESKFKVTDSNKLLGK
jgi:hypothetical protein